MKKVTVIMSAYNGSKYIERQLDSIFRLKDVDVTCYVRNDGSTDKTLEVLNNFTLPPACPKTPLFQRITED